MKQTGFKVYVQYTILNGIHSSSSDPLDFLLSSTTDDLYATELLRQNLTNALEREDNLKQALQTAQIEIQSVQANTLSHMKNYQQLDSLLEAEEAKTHAERLARQLAEETTRQHRTEAAKLRKNEAIANQHCEAAEAEVISLQRDLSTERSALVTAGKLTARLREELRQAEANGMAAYDMLNDARAKIRALEQNLKLATDRISMLEQQARGFEEMVEKGHLRVTEAAKNSSATAFEIMSKELKFSELLEKYNALEIEHSKCHSALSLAATNLNTAIKADDTYSPISIPNAESPPSKLAHNQINSTTKKKAKNETPLTNPTSPTLTAQPQVLILNPPQPELPTIPSPAILCPRLASATTCHVEILKASGRIVTAPAASNTKNLRWKFFWRLPGELLRLLIGDCGWR